MDSGEVLWRREGYRCRAPPAIVDNTVYFLTKNGTVVAMDVDDGSVRWTGETGGSQTNQSPAVGPDGDRLYVATGNTGSVVALDTDTGDKQWGAAVGPTNVASNPPVVAGDTVLVGTKGIYGLDAATGEQRWSVLDGIVETEFRRYGDTLITIVGDSVVGLRWDDT